jgi:lysophospholipid acyltransferase (LPLAT)-like uncharacterized protein
VRRFFRLKWVQSTLALLISGWIAFALATMRWTFVNREAADAACAAPEGIIGCFWHGRIAMAVVCKRVLKTKPRRVLISLSPDGEFIAQAVERLGFPAIRGSAGRKGKDKAKGGASAFRAALRFLAEGGVIAITPDGPRGPNQTMPDGPITLARTAQVPVFLFGLAATPAIQLKSWDKGRIPLPFTRGCVVFDGPLQAPREADAETLEALRADWQARLIAAQQRAEAVLAGGEA